MPPSEEVCEILTEKEAADFLKVQPQTLAKWRMQKTGPPYSRLGIKRGTIRYRTSVLVKWVEENEQGA